MKKLIAILATVSLTLTVASCGDEAPKNSSYVNSATEAGASSVGGSDAALQAVEEPAEVIAGPETIEEPAEDQWALEAAEEPAESVDSEYFSEDNLAPDFDLPPTALVGEIPSGLDQTGRANWLADALLSALPTCDPIKSYEMMPLTDSLMFMIDRAIPVNVCDRVGTVDASKDRMHPINEDLTYADKTRFVKVYYTQEQIDAIYAQPEDEISHSSASKEFEFNGYTVHCAYFRDQTYAYIKYTSHDPDGISILYWIYKDDVPNCRKVFSDGVARAEHSMDPFWGTGLEYSVICAKGYNDEHLIPTYEQEPYLLGRQLCKIYKSNDGIHDYEQWYPVYYYFGY